MIESWTQSPHHKNPFYHEHIRRRHWFETDIILKLNHRNIEYGWLCLVYNYPPKGRWIVVDIYRDAKRRGIHRSSPTLRGIVVLVFTKSDG